MKQIIKSQLTDRSDQEKFCFALNCKECGREWRSAPIRFSKAGEAPPTEAKRIIANTLYLREHAQAMGHAINEAVQHFNVCPLCHGLVCNYCFIICEDLDMCRSCTNALQETGEAVMERALSEACG